MVELVDRSMVEPDAIGHTRRYRLLETLRHYGSGTARQARRRHRPAAPTPSTTPTSPRRSRRSPPAPSRASPSSSTSWRWPTSGRRSNAASPPTTSSWPVGSPRYALDLGYELARLRGGDLGAGAVRSGQRPPAADRHHADRDRRDSRAYLRGDLTQRAGPDRRRRAAGRGVVAARSRSAVRVIEADILTLARSRRGGGRRVRRDGGRGQGAGRTGPRRVRHLGGRADDGTTAVPRDRRGAGPRRRRDVPGPRPADGAAPRRCACWRWCWSSTIRSRLASCSTRPPP